jgi:hypothetical protein
MDSGLETWELAGRMKEVDYGGAVSAGQDGARTGPGRAAGMMQKE